MYGLKLSYLSFSVQEARYFGKKYVFTKSSLSKYIFFHTLSLIKGCEEKKSERLENGYCPVEKTMIIQEKLFPVTVAATVQKLSENFGFK